MPEIFHRRSVKTRATPDALQIVIKYWFGWPVFAFITVWTSLSGYQAGVAKPGSSDLTTYIARIFFLVGIGMMIWLVCGRETIMLREQSITIFRGVFGIGRRSTFFTSDLHDIRVGSFLDPHARGKWERRFIRARLVFEYRGKTEHFGLELSEPEAERILRTIRHWNSQLVYAPADVPAEELPIESPGLQKTYRSTSRIGPNPIVLLLFGLWILWGFGVETVGARLELQIDGVVISTRNIPPMRGPRYATEYTLRGRDGQNEIYVSGPTDASLPRDMPVGTYLRKQRWRLAYQKNGELVDDFPWFFYQLTMGVALGCVIWSLFVWHGQRQASQT